MVNENPEDSAETSGQREERRERYAVLHNARRERGHVRSVLLRDEDYTSYDTRVWDMAGEDFTIFWLTYLYGGEFFESFEKIMGNNHLWRAVIVRRRASPTSEDVIREEPVILVDLDKCDALVRISKDVWQYAFEKRRGESEFNLNIATREPAAREDTVQVILASARAGIIVKGPICLLLVLAQAKVPLQDFLPLVAAELSPEWGKVWALQQECDALLKKSARSMGNSSVASSSGSQTNTGSLDILGLTLEFPKQRVQELLDILVTFAHVFIPNYVYEVWVLVAGDVTGNVSQPYAVNPDALVGRTSFQEGDNFSWVPLALREGELYAAWQDTPRVVRSERLGEKYYLNTARAAWSTQPSINWREIEGMKLLVPKRTKLHPVRLGPAGEPFGMRPVLSGETAATAARGTPFAAFWTDVVGRDLTRVEHRDGWYLFRDQTPVEIEGKATIRETDLIVKDLSLPGRVRPYCGGGQAFLDLFSLNGFPTRWFTLDPGNECTERDAGVLRETLAAWAGSASSKMAHVVKCLIRLREEAKLDVDIHLGDLFGNQEVTSNLLAAEGAASIVNAWEYDPRERRYVAIEPDSAALDRAKVLFQRAKDKAGGNPILLHLQLQKLKQEHPAEYEALAAEVEKMLPEEEGEEEDTTSNRSGYVEEDDLEALEEGNEKGDWLDGAEVIEENDYFITYRDREGYEFGFEKDDSTAEEDYWKRFELTPEDLAGAPTMPENFLDVSGDEEGEDEEDEGDADEDAEEEGEGNEGDEDD